MLFEDEVFFYLQGSTSLTLDALALSHGAMIGVWQGRVRLG
jgi:hypothetical protein